jgi:hypothetical protein
VLSGRALFFFSAALHNSRSHLHICRAPRHFKTGGRTPARISRLDFCRNWFALVSTRDCDRDLHPNRGPLTRETHPLLVRIRYGLHRMPLPSLRNNSWSIHNYRAFTRIGESIVPNRGRAKVHDLVLVPYAAMSGRRLTGHSCDSCDFPVSCANGSNPSGSRPLAPSSNQRPP